MMCSGNGMLQYTRMSARTKPMGIHMKVSSATIAVGRRTHRPSWKISCCCSWFIGTLCHFPLPLLD
ncbi:hypothetical protein DsansV1_C02g0024011 [Dioscorea sansibarensis]